MQAVFYRDPGGSEPVNDFIDQLSPERQEAIDHTIRLLNRLGPNDPPLPFPFSSQVRGQLRELRCHYGREHYRILYHRSRNLFVLLHILEKRSKVIPERDTGKPGLSTRSSQSLRGLPASAALPLSSACAGRSSCTRSSRTAVPGVGRTAAIPRPGGKRRKNASSFVRSDPKF